MTRITIYVTALVIILFELPAYGQAAGTCSFDVLFEQREMEANFNAFIKPGGEAGKATLVFSRLSFKDVSMNDHDLRMLITRTAVTLENGRFTDFNNSRFGNKVSADYDIAISNPAKPLVVTINPLGFESRTENVELKRGRTLRLQYTATTSAEPSSSPESSTETEPAAEREQQPRNNPPKPAAEEPKLDLETQLFKKAMGNSESPKRSEALIAFLDKFPNTAPDRKSEALRYIRTEFNPTKKDNSYIYVLKYALNPVVVADTFKVEIGPVVRSNDGGYMFTLSLKPGFNSEQVTVRDAGKIAEFQSEVIALERDMQVLDVTLENLGGTQYKLILSGGKPSFQLHFYDENGRVVRLSKFFDATNQSIIIDTREIQSAWNDYGTLTLRLVQEKGNITKSLGTIAVPKPSPIWPYFVLVLAVVALLYGFNRYRQSIHRKAFEKKIEKKQEAQPETERPQTPVPDPAMDASAPVFLSNSAFKIRPANTTQEKDKKALSEERFANLLMEGFYQPLNLLRNWPDTALRTLHLGEKSIQDIDHFLHSQRQRQIEEQEGTIPEIGGFLLGHYCFFEKNNGFQATIEAFVPIVPEENNVYQLQFSTESLVRELGEAQDLHPDLSLVGWFHTHPGHGLFLSKPDMTIQDGFFRERFQFAMEIDTLTDNLDTGFFTRTTAGTANNIDTLVPGNKWFHWTEIARSNRDNPKTTQAQTDD